MGVNSGGEEAVDRCRGKRLLTTKGDGTKAHIVEIGFGNNMGFVDEIGRWLPQSSRYQ